MRSLPFVLDLDESNGGKVRVVSLCVEVGGSNVSIFFGGDFFIQLVVTHLKISIQHVLMEVWKMIFLYKWVMCRFQVPC